METAERLSASLAGDATSAGELLRPLLGPAYRLAYMLLRDREAAEDAVQDAALKSWRKLSSLPADADLRPWFMRFVANECRNMRRSRWRAVLKLGMRDDIPSAESQVVTHLDLHRAVNRLSHDDRVVVLLRFYLDMTVEEIAVATGRRAAAVRSRLYRAVKRLQPHLDGGERSNV
jgi:RNA polymerase sigma-70 factor (ECF subfamily)